MGTNNFSHGRPLCVQMNDFTSDAKIWTVNLQSHGAQSLKSFAQTPTMFTAGLAKYDPFWATNDCEVSKLRYLPIKVDYHLTMRARRV